MTATEPVDLLVLLDRLEELRAKATVEFPWRQDSGYGEDVLTRDGLQFGVSGEPADAALIVAAVNAVPALVAALRRVQAVADELDEFSEQEDFEWHSTGTLQRVGARDAFDVAVSEIRTALAAVDPT